MRPQVDSRILQKHRVAPFHEVMVRLNATQHQIPASRYGTVGHIPVVDQGQKAIVGYTDDLLAVFEPGRDGVIVFGDHTCATKFIDFPFAIGADGTQLIKAKGTHSTRFLAYALEADPVAGTGYNRHFKLLREKTLPAPSRREQDAIVKVLSDIDDLIATLERMIAKKQAIKQGMMQQLLTGRIRLPGFTDTWHMVTLDEVTHVTMGQSPAGASYNGDGRGVPLVQGNADIGDRHTIDRLWTTEPTKRCHEGDVVLTVRAPVGYAAVASRDVCLGRGVCSVAGGFDNRFLFHALVYAEPRWALYEQGSTFTSVTSNEVRSFAIDWPSDSEERRAIASVLDTADSEILLLRVRLAKAAHVKQGMMGELLTGRTRLSDMDSAV